MLKRIRQFWSGAKIPEPPSFIIPERVESKNAADLPSAAGSLSTNCFFVTCVGYFEMQVGVSEVARNFFDNLIKNGVQSNIVSIDIEGREKISCVDRQSYKKHQADAVVYNNQIYFVNADRISHELSEVKKNYKNKRTRIFGVFWWEFNDYFYFDEGLKCVDHIIVFSDFIKEAIEKSGGSRIKTTKLLYPLKDLTLMPDESFLTDYCAKKKINKDDYVYFYNFDMHSCFERKNPMGLLKAFYDVSKNIDNVKLILKISNGNEYDENMKEIVSFINTNRLQSKVVLDENLYNKNELLNIMNRSDCYVSLHRSEGLGLGMMDAMQLGKPVIATNYGGNTEFTNSNNACMVDFKICEVQNDYGPYKRGYLWADPNIEQATEYMKYLALNREAGKVLGMRAQVQIRAQYSFKNIQGELYHFFRMHCIK